MPHLCLAICTDNADAVDASIEGQAQAGHIACSKGGDRETHRLMHAVRNEEAWNLTFARLVRLSFSALL